jgi:hypothetical protein
MVPDELLPLRTVAKLDDGVALDAPLSETTHSVKIVFEAANVAETVPVVPVATTAEQRKPDVALPVTTAVTPPIVTDVGDTPLLSKRRTQTTRPEAAVPIGTLATLDVVPVDPVRGVLSASAEVTAIVPPPQTGGADQP